MWDGKPFGYFEIYWVKEDILGRYLGDKADNYDRGIHVLVGEEEFRGKHRVKCWITALAHWAFIEDYRTNAVVLEPRIDNERYLFEFHPSATYFLVSIVALRLGNRSYTTDTDVCVHRFISTLNEAGFLTEGEVAFPHKQSAFVKLRRDNFEAPAL